MSLEIKNYDINFTNSIKLWCETKISNVYQLAPIVKPQRSIHAYCIGLPRSGTHSVSYMFSRNYRSRHEPRAHNTILHLLNYLNGKYSKAKFCRLLKYHDDIVHCDMESSHYLHYVVNIMADLFPDAKFILTVRDPLSWLNSEIKQNLSTKHYPIWKALEEYRYSRYGNSFTKEDKYLEDLPYTYPVANYLKYWSDHINKVLDSVPSERLLILNTNGLNEGLELIAEFLSIGADSIETMHAHSARNKEFNIYDHINEDYVINETGMQCGNTIKLLNKYYGIEFENFRV